jgi:isocitrate dehydrogenase kinase/phosphatase
VSHAVGVDLLLAGFDAYRLGFLELTRSAHRHFEARDWPAIRVASVRRLGLHGEAVAWALEALGEELGAGLRSREVWLRLRSSFAEALLGRDDLELAQTFFNSVCRRALGRRGVDPELDFLAEASPLPFAGWEMAAARTYAVAVVDGTVMARLLLDAGLEAPFRDLHGDAREAASRVMDAAGEIFPPGGIQAFDVLRAPFFRNKAAYLVGRLRGASAAMPVILALLHRDDGVEVDAVLTTEDDASIVFSFARWYFLADVETPRQAIGFLRSILPRKRIAELYISLGHHKHGKSELYADLAAQIRHGDERFAPAPGEHGLVMSVFTLPTWEFVFKVIRDRFGEPKRVSPREVMERYRLVLRHDRVGRLVDFQEFEHLAFPRDRFQPEVLGELLRTASRRVSSNGDEVAIRHLYVGRRVTPMDVYLAQDHPPQERAAAVLDWGQAIKDLAAADLFAGDLLLKNFGLTRHGRVVFYDYDELMPVTACRFRRLPAPRDEIEELSPEPWFPVREGDVFPEELPRFLELTGPLREIFVAAHGDLFELGFWEEMQERNRRGELVDVFPYPEGRRLRPERSVPMDQRRAPTSAR